MLDTTRLDGLSPRPASPDEAGARGGDRSPALLFRVPPVEGESLLSLVCRAAARNHLPSARPALALIEAPADIRSLHHRPDLAPALARLIGVAAGEVASRLYGPRRERAHGLDAEREFFGTRVPAHWLTTAKRIAPAALAEAPHHRAVWDLAILDVCPDSGEPLLEDCPHCRRRLNWTPSVLSACAACGTDLARMDGKPARRVAEADLAGARFVADLLAPWGGGRAAALARLPKELRILPPVGLLRLMLLLPDIIPGDPSEARRRAKREKRERRPHRALAAVLAVLEGWPDGLHAALDRRAATVPSQGRFGIHRYFGPSFVPLLQEYEKAAARSAGGPGSPPSAHEVLLGEIGRYFAARPRMSVGRNARLTERVRAASEREAGLRRAASMAEVMERIGWKHPRLRRLADLWPEVVVHSDGRGSGAPMLLDVERVLHIASTLEAALSVPEAADALGISQPVCRDLVERGLLVRLEDRFARIHEVSASETLVTRASVEEIASRLDAGAQQVTDRSLTLRAVVSSVTLLGLGAADVVALMLDGRLPYHRAPPARSQRKARFPFAFDRASVERFCAAERSRLPMAIKAAAGELRWNQQTVLSMLRLGEMRALPGKAKYGATLIARDEVARAKREYLTTADAGARLFPDRPLAMQRVLAKALRCHGLEPVVGDGGAAGRTGQLIWRTRDVDAIDHEALLACECRLGPPRPGRRNGKPRGRRP